MRAFDLQRALDSLRQPSHVAGLSDASPTMPSFRPANDRARRTAIENKTDQLVEQFHAKNPDPALREDVWNELERILDLADKRERQDALEDVTLGELIYRAMRSRAEAMEKAGLL